MFFRENIFFPLYDFRKIPKLYQNPTLFHSINENLANNRVEIYAKEKETVKYQFEF